MSIKNACSDQKLCLDIYQEIISRIDLKEISVCSLVNKVWYRFAKKNLEKMILQKTLTFNADVWNTYYGNVGKEPALPKNLVKELKDPCPFFKNKRKFETHILCLIPQTVDQIPLTIELFEKRVQKPERGLSSKIGHICHFTRSVYQNKSPEKSYWILMVKKIVKESIGDATYWSKMGAKVHSDYRQPSILEALSCLFLKHVSSKKKNQKNLLGKEKTIYIWCQNELRGNTVVVGCDEKWEEANGGLVICMSFRRHLVGYQPVKPLLDPAQKKFGSSAI